MRYIAFGISQAITYHLPVPNEAENMCRDYVRTLRKMYANSPTFVKGIFEVSGIFQGPIPILG